MTDEKQTTETVGWLEWLGKRRDGFLVAGASIYGLGYMVWTYNAWDQGLGLLPAIESQYFLAGIVPALIIYLCWVAIVFAYRQREKVANWFEGRRRLRSYVLYLGVATPSLGLSAFVYSVPLGLIGNPGSTVKAVITYSTALVIFVSMYVFALGFNPKDRTWRVQFQTLYAVIVFGAAAIGLYILLYPHLPQAFGGVKPRCAYVDVAIKKVSTDTLRNLAEGGALDNKQLQVVRTKKLNVFFSGRDFMLVRPQSEKPVAKIMYELKKDVIKAITWCD